MGVFKVPMWGSWAEFDQWSREQRNSIERRAQEQRARVADRLRYDATMRLREHGRLMAQLNRAELTFSTTRPTPGTYEVTVTHLPTGYTTSSAQGGWHGSSMHATWLGQKNAALRALLARLNVRALSVRQPWAALILDGAKTVENRTWPTRWRGTLAIHAGARPDPAAAELATTGVGSTPLGAYLGAVELVDVHHDRDCRIGCGHGAQPGVWHWVLRHPRRLAEPIPAPGQLRVYPPPPHVLAAITALAGEH